MKTIFCYIAIGLWVTSCCEEKKELTRAFIIGDELIYLQAIDSLIEPELYRIRKETLAKIIAERIIKKEADYLGLDFKAFKESNLVKDAVVVSEKEIQNFMETNPAYMDNRDLVVSIISGFKTQERLLFIADSLKDKYGVKLFLTPPSTKVIDTHKLLKIPLNNVKADFEVVLVFNFECPLCIEKTKHIEKLSEKYGRSAGFSVAYLNHNYGQEGKAVVAAIRQDKGWQMTQAIASQQNMRWDNFGWGAVAKAVGLDVEQFQHDMKDSMVLVDLLLTRDFLFSEGVFHVPGLIIDGHYFEENLTIDQIEELIRKRLAKKQ